MNIDILLSELSKTFKNIYQNDSATLDYQTNRYQNLIELYSNIYNYNKELSIISTPGRTEIIGNHTDHNGGKVIAASINLDTVIAYTQAENEVKLKSDQYEEIFHVDLSNLDPIEKEKGTTSSLIRGIAAGFVKHGYKIGGFYGVLTSDVKLGSGLSSSASVEVTIGSVFNQLYNDNQISPSMIAKIGQFAENKYFGKPCGLMDQMVCAVGGIVSIDFKDPNNPKVEKINYDFESQGYKLLIVDTGENHEDLTNDYASIPKEMKSVADFFEKEVCRGIDLDTLLSHTKDLRNNVGDRAILRAFHFLNENERVTKLVDALNKNNFTNFLHLINESGNSSFKWLQNIYSITNVKEQSVSLSLALTEKFIEEKNAGACRVHGGGFAGTIQVFLPGKYVEEYKNYIESVLGKDKVLVLSIRSKGTICLKE